MLTNIAQLGALTAPAPPDPNAKLKAQAKGLEGVFLNTLMKTMFSSVKTDGPFGGGFGEETWRGMQAQQFADNFAQAGGVGLADQITRNLLDMQEALQPPLQPQPSQSTLSSSSAQGASH